MGFCLNLKPFKMTKIAAYSAVSFSVKAMATAILILTDSRVGGVARDVGSK
jgi:hypothetical protein